MTSSPPKVPVLQPHSASPIAAAIGFGCFAFFWNGFMGIGTVAMVKDGLSAVSFLPLLFLIPFWIIGLVLLGIWLTCVATIFNPRTQMEVGRETVYPGQTVPFSFAFGRGLRAPQSVKITLEGREEATFTRGTDTVTDKSPFFHQTIFESTHFQPNGSGTFDLPLDVMHTFEGKNNKILWIIKIYAPIPHWADVSAEWRLRVEPRSQ